MSLRQQFDPLFTQLFKDFGQSIQNTALQAAFPALADTYYRKLDEPLHGDLPRWVEVISRTQALVPSVVDLSQDRLLVGQASDLSTELAADWTRLLMQQHPWRKGPFALFGTHIDTEWRSDWKWQRVAPHIAPLQDRVVLDVGCGSGYHVWRMLGAGARCVLGVEPMWQYVMQFALLKQWISQVQPVKASVLPLTLEDLPALPQTFDTIFSMGVLYHRRDPLQHLMTLKSMLVKGGELVLETLVVEGDVNTVLMPEDRYCRMRNVWFLPSVAHLIRWCERLGFVNVRAVDLNWTSVEEQRRTNWMTYDSLSDALDPQDPRKTVEGLPAPLRVVLVMNT